MNYMKQRRKMIILLIIGVVLAINLFAIFYLINGDVYVTASFSGIFIFIAIVCYPLALAFGKHQIIDIFNSIWIGDRQPFRLVLGKEKWKTPFTVLNFIFAAFTTVVFGWVYGTYNAYKKLQYLKAFK